MKGKVIIQLNSADHLHKLFIYYIFQFNTTIVSKIYTAKQLRQDTRQGGLGRLKHKARQDKNSKNNNHNIMKRERVHTKGTEQDTGSITRQSLGQDDHKSHRFLPSFSLVLVVGNMGSPGQGCPSLCLPPFAISFRLRTLWGNRLRCSNSLVGGGFNISVHPGLPKCRCIPVFED